LRIVKNYFQLMTPSRTINERRVSHSGSEESHVQRLLWHCREDYVNSIKKGIKQETGRKEDHYIRYQTRMQIHLRIQGNLGKFMTQALQCCLHYAQIAEESC